MAQQQTIAQEVKVSGIGLHSGVVVQVTLKPAQSDRGRYFSYQGQIIPAHISAVSQTLLSTELRANGVSVRTVEHLLAALVGMEIDNICIELDQHELPILDGSALPWVEAIAAVGTITQDQPRPTQQLHQHLICQKDDGFVTAIPSSQLKFTYGIEFPTAAIGTQWYTWQPHSPESFASAIAPARTFTLASQIEHLRAANLIRGGSLENAIVCDDKKWLNPPLRFDNEPCRHKLLDLMGDFSLIGTLPPAHYLAYKASHTLHTQFIRILHDHIAIQ
ncbi:MAG: UDP-3-O-acyl-N-acetylglucosamine deacetylase [Pseudanabaenaceae cyanobacterium bins.68]|nr:UDP-3-O-acyl-N-acetylglucosamine deacetylase [Pseudanabaenaceae cyanobacterium bins.68]